MRSVFLICVLGALSACSSSPVRLPFTGVDCSGQDWFEIGRQDGAIGLSTENFNVRTKECTKIELRESQENYQLGHSAGVSEYCSAESGFALGRSGMDYNKICPEQLAPELMRGYHKGLQANFLDLAIQRLDQQIETLRNRLSTGNVNELQRQFINNQTAQLVQERSKTETKLEKLKTEL